MTEQVQSRILIVDDKAANLLALEVVLEQIGGIEFIRANSGAEALKLLKESKEEFAVILLDVMMPVIDGFEVARRVRAGLAGERSKVIPVIFMTAATGEQSLILKAYALGAVDFLFKPFDPEILRSKVQVFVDLQRASRARQRAEEELRIMQEKLARQVEERLTMAAEASGLGLWHFDPPFDASRQFSCNDQGRLHLGLARTSEITVGMFFEGIHKEDRDQVREAVEQSAAELQRVDVEFRIEPVSSALEEERWIRFVGRGLGGAQGELLSFDAITFDLTDRKRAESELRAAHDAALEASHAKSTFLANMSHELRTPLNAIIGYSEMLLEEGCGTDDETSGSDLKKISEAGKHLLILINDILDLSKIEAGRMELYVRPFDVCSMIAQVVDTTRPLIERNANTLTVNCPPAVAGTMIADDIKVRQILLNLLSNAGKFAKHGNVTLEVERIHPSGSGGKQEGITWIAFRVKDTGIGMSSDEMSRLFRDFSQIDSSTTRQYGGTGLGLAISRRFARMMGGDISVRSEQGHGSTFTVTLPAKVEGLAHPTGGEETPFPTFPSRHAPQRESPLLAPAFAANTVLVIDDDATVHDLVRRHLEKAGFRVISAFDGRHGVELAQQVQPRVITLDVTMPRMDGWAVLSELKSDPRTVDIPVIMASVIEDRGLAFALGAADYLTKPLDRDRLVDTLRRHQFDLKGHLVLVVEDDDATRELVGRTVASMGSKVLFATDGKEALRVMEETGDHPPELIVLDLMMPNLDGFGFLEVLRRKEAWRRVPVLVTTAKELTSEDRRRLRGQVEQVLQKGDYTRDDLMQEIDNTLKRSR